VRASSFRHFASCLGRRRSREIETLAHLKAGLPRSTRSFHGSIGPASTRTTPSSASWTSSSSTRREDAAHRAEERTARGNPRRAGQSVRRRQQEGRRPAARSLDRVREKFSWLTKATPPLTSTTSSTAPITVSGSWTPRGSTRVASCTRQPRHRCPAHRRVLGPEQPRRDLGTGVRRILRAGTRPRARHPRLHRGPGAQLHPRRRRLCCTCSTASRWTRCGYASAARRAAGRAMVARHFFDRSLERGAGRFWPASTGRSASG